MKKVLTKILCAACLLTLCGCTQKAGTSSAEDVNYTIAVDILGVGGKKGINVNLVQGDSVKYTGTTDRSGKVTITAPAGEYKVVASDLSDGLYQVSDLNASTTEENKLQISSKLIEKEEPENVEYYKGSIVYDHTFTMSDGTSVSIKDALKDKDAVVINFWGIACGYCVAEMPDLNTFYGKYKEQISLIAVNGYNSLETAKEINEFIASNNLDFKSTVFDDTYPDYYGVTGFPTTIVIDRYGRYAAGYSGYMSSEEGFEKLVTPVLGDSYVPEY